MRYILMSAISGRDIYFATLVGVKLYISSVTDFNFTELDRINDTLSLNEYIKNSGYQVLDIDKQK